jgi:hypothetical protein
MGNRGVFNTGRGALNAKVAIGAVPGTGALCPYFLDIEKFFLNLGLITLLKASGVGGANPLIRS